MAPLDGVRIADFSWVGAGPFLTKPLADHGAEVIKIESRVRTDVIRSMPPFRDGVPGVGPQRLLRRPQLQQALDLPGPARPGGPRPRAATDRGQRRRGQQLHPGHHGPARARLRRGPRGPAGHRLPRDADAGRLRPAPRLPRLRPVDRGRGRGVRPVRLSRPAPGRHRHQLPGPRAQPAARRDRGARRAAAPPPHRPGLLHRAGPAGVDGQRDRPRAGRRGGRARGRAGRQRRPGRRAARRLPVRRPGPVVRDRGDRRRPVARPGPGAGLPGVGRGLRHPGRPARRPGPAGRPDRLGHPGLEGPRPGRRADRGRGAGRARAGRRRPARTRPAAGRPRARRAAAAPGDGRVGLLRHPLPALPHPRAAALPRAAARGRHP